MPLIHNLRRGRAPPGNEAARLSRGGEARPKDFDNGNAPVSTRPSLDLQASRENRRLRRQCAVERVHRLGARVVYELLDEIDRYHDLGDDLDCRLDRYAALNPDVLRALGGDRLPAPPIHRVGGVG